MKKILSWGIALCVAAAGFTLACAQEKAIKKAVFVIAQENFQDDEFAQPLFVLQKKGVEVTVASTTLSEVTGMNGAKVTPEMLVKEIKADDFDIVVFIGGSGATQYIDDPVAHALARDALAKNKIVGAICIAPRILASAGLLKGKKATVYPTEGDALKACEAEYTAQPVEKDGNIITADGPESAAAFGEALSQALFKS